MNKYILKIAIVLLAVVSFGACSDDDDKGGGTPVIRYIRPCDVESSDSLLVKAYLGERIAIIGENLGGIREIYFNDQKAELNPNFITGNAIIVSIPQGIPGEKQDIITFKTTSTSVTYDFETLVPVPLVNSMTCEYVADGDIAEIQGYYFVHEDGNPLKVTFPGGLEGEIIYSDVNNIRVKVPEGAERGALLVTSVYGTGESSLHFRDERNIILDFDTVFPDGYNFHGWHGGAGYGTANGPDNQYLIFSGKLEVGQRNDDNFGYERWTYRTTDPDFFNSEDLEGHVLKFEVNVTETWSAGAFQIIFTGHEDVLYNWQDYPDTGGNPNNAYVQDETYPRALWMPWANTANGTYTTDGWITVTIPMTEFKYNDKGQTVQVKGPGHYSGISLLVYGSTGVECNPVFHIDNVRVVEK